MRNKFKIVSSLGAAALLLSGAAMAAPPAPFGNWTVTVNSTTGVVSDITDNTGAPNPCGSGAVTGAGFQQCELTIGTDRFIRTRIADATFRSEDFVKIGGGGVNIAGSGLASTMAINEVKDGTTFGTTADIMTGWGVSAGSNDRSQATLGLTLATAATSATAFDAFNATFGVTAVTNASGVNQISALSVGQTVQLGAATDKQRFELKNVGAQQVLWAGQSVTAAGDFSISVSKDVNTGVISGTKTNLGGTAVDATVWTAAFGAAPTF